MKVSSRDRADILLNTVRQYVSLAAKPEEMCWLFSFDSDDKSQHITELRDLTGCELNDFVFLPRCGKIGSVNRDINAYTKHWDVILNISDDQVPIVQGYDDKIRANMKPGLSLWFYDNWQGRINTQEIQHRDYYNIRRYLYHPSYHSFFCDNEATEVARKTGKLKMISECIIRHDHYQWNPHGMVKDGLYIHNDKFWNVDQQNYNQRRAKGFPV